MDKTGPEWLSDIGNDPTIDELLDRDPHARPYTRQQLLQVVEASRRERSLFNIKNEKREAKKDGVEEIPA